MREPDPEHTTASEPDAIWYVAYGSNLSDRRLARYLRRHAVEAGRSTHEEPLASVAMTIDHRLFFAHESRVWTGGSAFIDPEPTAGTVTLVRAWLLRRDQFTSVVSQENGRAHLAVPDAVFALDHGDRLAVDDRRYGLVLGCPSPDERPALTFTTPERPLPPETKPASAYVETIVSGLVDGHALAEHEARAYVVARTVR